MDIVENSQSDVKQMVNMKKRFFLFGLGILLLIFALIGGMIGLQAKKVYAGALKIQPLLEKAQGNFTSQDLPALRSTLAEINDQIGSVKNSYSPLSQLKFIPFGGKYITDGQHLLTAVAAGVEASEILVDAVEPYADVLGFQGSGSFTGGTAEDRVIAILGTLDKVAPKLDDMSEKLKIVDGELAQIDENRYNFTFKEKNIAEQAKKAKEVVHALTVGISDARPAIEVLPKIAGMDGEKKYMVLFHNDGELRGTGGFMTAYGILRVDKGKVAAEKSSDIYDLDGKFKERLQPPGPIKKYLKVPYWYLRDMNYSPDFKQNMDLFYSYYKNIKGEPKIDGIIGVDTNFLVSLLKILGPTDVPGFGRFSAENDPRCNCPQVVYQLELIADRPVATVLENRKGSLGPMMREIIFKAYAAPKPWWDDLLRAFGDDISAKHIVFYFMDENLQSIAEKLNIAGKIDNTGEDYLMVVDSNFGGAKSNLFIKEDVSQEMTIGNDGTITKKLTVTYTNTAPASNCNLEAGQLCLNATVPDVTRVYVPLGSKLVEAIGFDDQVEVKEDSGKTVLEGFVRISPQSSTKTIYTYTLPWKSSQAPKNFLIQKQVGKENPHYKIELPDRVEEFDLSSDKNFSVNR
ncbi:DUF4012 domain-containing protein [Candidatus Collierbacteria bacterium]|nr:DUF4012 domain-containing protein [Candidatus Collierbacteria bacterium]